MQFNPDGQKEPAMAEGEDTSDTERRDRRTDEGIMRQPVFLRLREDKAAREMVREKPGGK